MAFDPTPPARVTRGRQSGNRWRFLLRRRRRRRRRRGPRPAVGDLDVHAGSPTEARPDVIPADGRAGGLHPGGRGGRPSRRRPPPAPAPAPEAGGPGAEAEGGPPRSRGTPRPRPSRTWRGSTTGGARCSPRAARSARAPRSSRPRSSPRSQSEVAGQAVAQVTEDVYDADGVGRLLIPQGTRVVGRLQEQPRR